MGFKAICLRILKILRGFLLRFFNHGLCLLQSNTIPLTLNNKPSECFTYKLQQTIFRMYKLLSNHKEMNKVLSTK